MSLKLPAFCISLTSDRDRQQPHGEQQHPAPGAQLHRHDSKDPQFPPVLSEAAAASQLVPSQGRLHVKGQQEWGVLGVGCCWVFLPFSSPWLWAGPRLGWMERRKGKGGKKPGQAREYSFFGFFSPAKKSQRMEGSELLQLE